MKLAKQIGLVMAVLAIGFLGNYALHIVEDGIPQSDGGSQHLGRMRELAKEIVNDIDTPSITARNAHGTIVLEGFADNKDAKIRAEQISQMYVRDYLPMLPRQVRVLNLIEVKGSLKVGADFSAHAITE